MQRPRRERSPIADCLTYVCHIALMTLALSANLQAQSAEGAERATDAESPETRIVGIVTDMDGMPLVDAKVRVVIPPSDLRFAVDLNKHREFWGMTDPTGSYSIKIDGVDQASPASLDIMHPGHRRLVGTLMSGGTHNEVKILPGKSIEFDAELPEAMYFAGRVVDESGEPIKGVLVASTLNTPRSSAGVERTMTDEQGRFEVFSYETKFLEGDFLQRGIPTASLLFQHDHHIKNSLRKLESIAKEDRDDLRIVMKSGFSLAGTVMDPQGGTAGDVLLSLSQAESGQRKAVRTDERGRFRIDGLSGGKAMLRIVDVWGNRKLIQPLTIARSDTEMTVSLQEIESPSTTEYEVLGMTLADVTPAISKAYELNAENTLGVMIVDPGERSTELEVGELHSGYVFWMVGNDRVRDLRTMVNQLVSEATAPTIAPGSLGNTSAWIEDDGTARVRVVYTFDSEVGRGTNTQYMRLEKSDIAELVKLQKQLQSSIAE